MYAFWPPIVTFDCILFGLALWAGTQHVKSVRGLNFPRSPMWDILLKDSLFYFSVYVDPILTELTNWLFRTAGLWRHIWRTPSYGSSLLWVRQSGRIDPYLMNSSMSGTLAWTPTRIFYCGNVRYGRQIGSQSPQGILYTPARRLRTGDTRS